MSKTIRFSSRPPRFDRRHVVTEADVRIVLQRLPAWLWERLRAVHLNDHGRGARCLGYVTRARDEIALCALPPRVSLNRYLRRSQSPTRFGAIRGCQWPALAVRRFMLYDVLLHEIGHMQLIHKNAKTIKRRYAHETRAQDFAEYWSRELWSQPFDHPDPVHNPPAPEELQAVCANWQAANVDYKRGLLYDKSKRYTDAVVMLNRAIERYPDHALALERLGILNHAGRGTTASPERAIKLLSEAIELDPGLADATLFLAMALARQNRETEARHCFERAIRLDPCPPIASAMYADALADWGEFREAEARFRKVINRDKTCVLAIRDYARSLIRHHNSRADENMPRAIALFQRAVAVDPEDAESQFQLGRALACLDDEVDRAIVHLQLALRIAPDHAPARALLLEIQEWLEASPQE